MGRRIVAVDDNLTGIRDLLQDHGYEVVSTKNVTGAHVIVTSGMDRNMLGMHDMVVRVPVIDVAGRTPLEVLSRVDSIFNEMQQE